MQNSTNTTQNMQENVRSKRRRIRRIWRNCVSVMACVVVFCVTYALILPAITMEKDTFCGVEAHVHDAQCYEGKHIVCDPAGDTELPVLHTHDALCYDGETLICTLAELAGHIHTDGCYETVTIEAHSHTESCHGQVKGALICTVAEDAGHTHTDACYVPGETLICAEEEREGHFHGDACYAVDSQLTCTLAEGEGHSHSNGCYTTENTLICTEEHTHGEDCYTQTQKLVCTTPEAPAHAHAEGCYTETKTLICQIPEDPGHAHANACYEQVLRCGEEEREGHTHTDACYEMVDAIICGKEENAETVTVYNLVCTQTQIAPHTHDGSCSDENGNLICTIQNAIVHQHTEACVQPSQREEDLICELQVHEHTLICYSDPTADLETAEDWEKTFADLELSGDWRQDVVALAKTQLGYEESTKNYIVEGDNPKGYTRYGDWYGIPYGDWCAMFASFCLDYAGVEGMPLDCNCPNWINALTEADLYHNEEEYAPAAGDIIFFDWNADDSSDHVGIVAEYFPADDHNTARIQCIEGNSGNTVRYTTYNLADPCIQGYGQLPLRKDETLTEEEAVPDDAENNSFDAIANAIETAANDGTTYSVMGRSSMMMVASPAASARAADTIDMTSLIDSVTVYKKLNGGWVEVGTGGTITDGEDLKFTIKYTVPGGALSNEKKTLVYKIPSNIKNVADSSGLVYNDAKEAVGTYVIDAASNSISITFFDTYVADSQLNKPIEGSISFKATVEKITQEGNESQEILFSDKVKIEMEVAEKEEVIGDVKVEKSIAKVIGGVITYEIQVTSETGTFSEVILTDEMTGGIRYKDGLTITDQNGQTVAFELADGSSSTNFALILPQMDPGDVYTITYNARPYNMVENLTLVKNKAIVNTTNSQNVDISDFAEVDHTFKFVDKTGELQGDGSILWTIVINEDKQDISGMVLADIMWDTDGSEKEFTGPVTITDSQGNSYPGITLPFTFPEGSKDTYTVTYTTTHDLVAGENSVKNRVGLGYGGENDYFYDDAEVGIGENNPLTKEGAFLGRDQETGKFLIQWTITVDTSKGPIPTTASIHDATYDTQYMTYAQLQAVFKAINDAVAPFGATISNKLAIIYGTYTEVWNDDIDTAGNSNVYNQFYVQFSKEIPQGQKISFTYTTSADGPPDTGLYYNQVSLNDKVFAGASVNHEYEHPVIEKVGVSAIDKDNRYDTFPDDEELNYEDLSELNGEKTVWWRLRIPFSPNHTGAITIKDVLPEGLELVESRAQLWGSLDTQIVVSPDENGKGQFLWYDYYPIDLQVTTGEDGRQTVTYSVWERTAEGLAGDFLDLFVICRFRDDFQWGDPNAVITQVPFANTVQVESPDGEIFDTDDHTFVVRYDQSHEVVSKLGTLTSLNELEYEVKLNVEGRDLDPTKDTIRVKDVLTYVSPTACPIRLYLKPGSVNVYDYTGGVKGALITSAKYTYTENASGTGDISYTHTLDLVLPDQQPMLLEYVYTVDGEPNDYYSYDMLNTCTITGIAEGSIDSDYQLEVKVNESAAQANVNGVYIYKVNADNNGLYLPGAVFNVYTWSSQTGQYVRVKHPKTSGKEEAHYAFTTDEDGCLMLNDATMEAIAYNTAYYITEVTPPSGYFNDPTPYYFYIQHADTNKNPVNIPGDFEGDALKTGALIYYYNEPATTKIVVQKKWQDHNGNPITVTAEQVEKVEFELWQKLEGTENSDKLYGTYTITPDANGIWKTTITGLPKGVVNSKDGTKGATYLYYIKEVTTLNYEVSYEYDDENDATIHDSGGINSGTITMTNRETEGYELPETGGTGTYMYTTAGLLLMLTSAAYLVYNSKKRRKEVT